MAKVTSTGSTGDLDAFRPKRTVYVARYSARDGWNDDTTQHDEHTHQEEITVEKCWPAAATVELGAALVKRGVASSAGIDPGRFMMFVLPRARSLGALQAEHPELRARSHETESPNVIGLERDTPALG